MGLITNELSRHEKKLLKALFTGLRIKVYKDCRFVAITPKTAPGENKRFELNPLHVNSLVGKALIKDTKDLEYLTLTKKGLKEARMLMG